MKIKNIIFSISLLLIIFLTRFFLLTKYPIHLTIDEASIGYNAYSILKTGKDEWGQFMPLSFRSVGDYKSPFLVYLTVPFVKVLGLTEIAVRLPVAIFSALSIFLFWLILDRFLLHEKNRHLSIISAILLSISPWHIFFSRSGFEAVIALFFVMLNFLFALKYFSTGKLHNFFLMALFAFLAAITYHSTKLFVPLFDLALLIYQRNFFLNSIKGWNKNHKKLFIFSFLTLILITIFFVKNFVFGPGSARAKMTFISQDFDYARVMVPTFLSHPLSSVTSVFGLILFWFKRYMEYFSPNFYITSGLNLATSGQPNQGILYLVEYPLFITGLILFLFNLKIDKFFQNTKLIRFSLLVWFFLGFLPASLANNTQHSLRSLNNIPVVMIFIFTGIIFLFDLLKRKHIIIKAALIMVLVVGYLAGIVRAVDFYTLHYPVQLSEHQQYGWKEMALFTIENHQKYDTVYVDHRFGSNGPNIYGIPHMYFLFYSAYDPKVYNSDSRRKVYNSDFENFIFTAIEWPDLDHSKNNMYIASPWSIPKQIVQKYKIQHTAKFLNGNIGFYAVSDR